MRSSYHNPSVSLWGSYQADDLIKLAEVTNTVKKSIVAAYMERLDKTEDEIGELMDAESWYVGQEAIDAGFCDGLIEGIFQTPHFLIASRWTEFPTLMGSIWKILFRMKYGKRFRHFLKRRRRAPGLFQINQFHRKEVKRWMKTW